MKPIRLPEPPSPTSSMGRGGIPEIFEGDGYTVIRRAVVIGNGYPGSENQCLGLVRALGLSDKHLFYRVTRPSGGVNEWLHWLPVSFHKKLDYLLRRLCVLMAARRRNKCTPLHAAENGAGGANGVSGGVGLASVLEADTKHIVKMAQDNCEKDGPLLVVASGRDTVSIASSIKRLATKNAFVIQIQHPRSQLNRFDLVITPQHDFYPLTAEAQQQVPRFLRRWITPHEPPAAHVVLTTGALHQIDFAALRSAASAWHDEFAPLPKPLLVVNIGWPTSCCRYGADLAKKLITSLLNVLESCGSVRITFSNKTPDKVSRIIIKELGNNPKIYIWDGEEPNPYMGHLAWADAFVITADSVSLISEACSTGKPVYTIGSERCRWKLSEFHKSLGDRGVVRPFTGSEDISESWSYPPLNDTQEAARRVHEALAKLGFRVRP